MDGGKLQTFKSLPEYPSVIFAIASKSTSCAISSFANITFKIFDLFAESGRLTINLHRRSRSKRCFEDDDRNTESRELHKVYYLRGSRLITASSRSNGLLVAASTKTLSLSFVRKPSQFIMNSFFILRIASCSPGFSRLPNMLST